MRAARRPVVDLAQVGRITGRKHPAMRGSLCSFSRIVPAASRCAVAVLLAPLAGACQTSPEKDEFWSAEGSSTGQPGTSVEGDATTGEATTSAATLPDTSGPARTSSEATSGAGSGTSSSSSEATSEDPAESSGASAGPEGTGAEAEDDADGSSSESGDGYQDEVCDGIDNDGDGIIDDVDVGFDGVCDCIRIATLGEPGRWGSGDVFSAWLGSRAVQGAVALGSEVITEELLAPYHVIVAEDVSIVGREYGEDEIAALSAWVEGGGGLMTLIGYADATEVQNVNRLLAPFGVGYAPEQILSRVGGQTIAITEWERHPVTDLITAVGVDNGYPVTGEGLVYAREQGYDVGIATEAGMGRVSVWGDEWITYDSEWVDRTDYQVERFWLNTIKWLTPPFECQVVVPG